MTLEVTCVPPAAGTADSGTKVWAGFRVKAGEVERYETVLMNITQASHLADHLQQTIKRAYEQRGGVPAEE